MESNIKLELYEIIELKYGDPINSISLTLHELIFGTMMGQISYYNLNKKSLKIISELNDDFISGTSFSNNLKEFYISIGDEKIIEFNKENFSYKIFNNYDNEEIHNNFCNSCFTLLDENKLLMLFLIENNDEDPIRNYDCNYIFKTIINGNEEKKNGNINISNYIVPFDFKNNNFIFLEFLTDNKRNLKINNFQNNEIKILEIDKFFGHISFIKFLKDDLLLIVRNYNIISIYDQFLICSSLYNHSCEINSIDFYYDNQQDLHIAFLDERGNITEGIFDKDSEKFIILFSSDLNSNNEINEILRKKGLFNMEYPYHIKCNIKYITVTTDNSLVIFKKV